MLWLLRYLASFLRVSPTGTRWKSDCYWCDHTSTSRSEGLAYTRMVWHIVRSEGYGPEDVPDEIEGDVDEDLFPSLAEGSESMLSEADL